jgi:dienelactone hydrolase
MLPSHPSRRSFLAGLAALPALTAVHGRPARAANQAGPAAATPGPVQLVLPEPTGHHQIGVVPLHLVDPSRRDPWVPTHPLREMMISVWYPARQAGDYPRAPWIPAGAGALLLGNLGVPAGAVSLPVTHGHLGAPAEPTRRPRPVVLFAAGATGLRSDCTALVEDLASHGYIVVTIDFTHEAAEVEFPGGRVEVSLQPPDITQLYRLSWRIADTRFVLSQLRDISTGGNPDVDCHPIPDGLPGALDLSRTGMFGFSLGGATAAGVMYTDPRVQAGLNMSGALYGPVIRHGLDRPLLLMADGAQGRDNEPSWAGIWPHLRGWHRQLQLLGSQHQTYTDGTVLWPQAAPELGIPPATLVQMFGTINGTRAITVQRAYVRAFMDLQLRGAGNGLLDAPSPRYPEIRFVP